MADGVSVVRPRKNPAGKGGKAWAREKNAPRRVSEIDARVLVRSSLGDPAVDGALAGGVVSGSVVLLGGIPGAGKSTRAARWGDALLRRGGGEGLFISAEMSEAEARGTFELAGVDMSRWWVWETRDLAGALAWARGKKIRALVVDSLPLVEVGRGGPLEQRRAALALVLSERARFACSFVLAHATKEGDLGGERWEEHAVSLALLLEPLALRVLKNRNGPSCAVELRPLLEPSPEAANDA